MMTLTLFRTRFIQFFWLFGLFFYSTFGYAAVNPQDLLQPEQAFQIHVEPKDTQHLQLTISIAPGYYLYRDRIHIDAKGFTLPAFTLPAGETKEDEFFGRVTIYRNTFSTLLTIPTTLPADASLIIRSQGCADVGVCYPPFTRTLSLNAVIKGETQSSPPEHTSADPFSSSPTPSTPLFKTPSAEKKTPATDHDASNTSSSNLNSPLAPNVSPQKEKYELYAQPNKNTDTSHLVLNPNTTSWSDLLWYLPAGFLLALTPCVLPIIPLLAGWLFPKSEEKHPSTRPWAAVAGYVIGSVTVYAAGGLIAGATGVWISVLLQNPWVMGIWIGLLIALGLSMLGFFNLQLPTSWQHNLHAISHKQGRGTWFGGILLGRTTALMMGPCLAPPFAALVMHIGQHHDWVFGTAAFALMGLGMTLPVILFTLSLKHWMPKPGPWMEWLRTGLGFLILASALITAEGWLPPPALLMGWGIWSMALGLSFWQGLYNHKECSLRQRITGATLGLFLTVVGISQSIGGLSGHTNPWKPLYTQPSPLPSASYNITSTELAIMPVHNLKELTSILSQQNGPVLLDVYASWCTSCREIEHTLLQDPDVIQAMRAVHFLKWDITNNTSEDHAFLKHYNVIAPPTFILWNAKSQEFHRFVGIPNTQDFLDTLHSLNTHTSS